jgi:hypothetical protein
MKNLWNFNLTTNRGYTHEDLTIYDEEQTVRTLSLAELAAPKTQSHMLNAPTATHKACITALNYAESPLRLLISGSRDGMLKVWR